MRVYLPLVVALLAGCMDQKSVFGDLKADSPAVALPSPTPSASRSLGVGDFDGCVTAVAANAESISVSYEWPIDAKTVWVQRNGVEVYSSTSGIAGSFIDEGLLEGRTYTYTCGGVFEDSTGDLVSKAGLKTVTATTIAENPPTFSGVKTSTQTSAGVATVTWSAATGVPANKYRVIAKLGSTVANSDFDLTDPATQSLLSQGRLLVTDIEGRASTQAVVSALGDELPYVFAVRACHNDALCDANTATRSLSLSDAGAAQTVGASAIRTENGSIWLTAPWTPVKGAVKKRRVYQSTNGTSFSLIRTLVISDLTSVATDIEVSGGIAENTTYYFYVQDEDPSGNVNTNTTTVSLNTGDLTAPTFAGITGLGLGANQETQLVATFTSIASEPGSASGASYYLFYTTDAAYPTVPADPCVSGTLTLQTAATGGAGVTVNQTISGLQPRRNYRVCVKARDLAGNTSSTVISMQATTQDKTAPTPFDGVQSITFDSNTSRIVVGWNSSVSSDTRNYIVSLYKNTATPTGGQITTFSRSHASYPSSASFSASDFAFLDGDRVYAFVNVCDTAGDLPGGSDNCTSLGTASSVNVLLPDISPPSGFNGISSASQLEIPAQGQVLVKWNAPGTWGTDYRGFRIYTLDGSNSLSLVKDCECASNGSNTTCDSPPYTQCLVTGLDARRTYKFHVRAYDAAGNVTQTDPVSSFANKTTTDTTAPAYASNNLSVGASPTFALTWTAATDNQYSGEAGAVINYRVYRIEQGTFADPTHPEVDGNLRATTTSLTFSEAGGQFTQGYSYQYTVCAVDASSNMKCPGQVQTFTVPDFTKPTITNLDTNWTRYKKKWDLTWSMSDNATATGSLLVRIFQAASSSATTLATLGDEVVFSGTGSTSATLEGPAGVQQYVHYLLEVTDSQGNKQYARLSVNSDNRITVTKVRTAHGPVAGGSFVVIHGTGFSNGTRNGFGTNTKVYFGSNECVNTRYIVPGVMTCETPVATGAGTASVRVENPDGSSATLSNAYTYTNAAVDICDTPGSWGADFAAGSGVSNDPYVICDSNHFRKMLQATPVNYAYSGKFYSMLRNVNLAGLTIHTEGAAYIASFDGNNHTFRNLEYSSASTGYSGLFGSFAGGGNYYFRNFGVIDVNISTLYSAFVLSPDLRNGGTYDISNIFTHGSIVISGPSQAASAMFGGFYQGGAMTLSNLQSNFTIANSSGGGSSSAGGIIGSAAVVGSLTMEDVHFEGSISATGYRVGGIIGATSYPALTLRRASVASSVSGGGSIGGLVGEFQYNIASSVLLEDCNFDGSVVGAATTVGGAIGQLGEGSSLTARRVQVSGPISSVGYNWVGGILGTFYNYGVNATIEDSHVRSDISGGQAVGGLVGSLAGGASSTAFSITNSSYSGTLTGLSHLGGLVGYLGHAPSVASQTFIGSSFTRGEVRTDDTVTTNRYQVGGLIGGSSNNANAPLSITNAYSTSAIRAYSDAGGVVGRISASTNTFTNVWAAPTSVVTNAAGLATTGALVGRNDSGATLAYGSSSLWNSTTVFPYTVPTGTNSGTVTGAAVSKTTSELQDSGSSLFSGLGYDFDETAGTWAWDPLVPGYPYLRENPPWVRR